MITKRDEDRRKGMERNFGIAVAKARAIRKMSMSALGRKASASVTTIMKLERGGAGCAISTGLLLAQALGMEFKADGTWSLIDHLPTAWQRKETSLGESP